MLRWSHERYSDGYLRWHFDPPGRQGGLGGQHSGPGDLGTVTFDTASKSPTRLPGNGSVVDHFGPCRLGYQLQEVSPRSVRYGVTAALPLSTSSKLAFCLCCAESRQQAAP